MSSPSQQAVPPRPRRALGLALVLLATLLTYLAVLALWVNRQVVDTENWAETSSALLEEPAIRDPLAVALVDRLYENVDVEAEIRAALPERAAPLAGPAAGALRDAAERGARAVLEKPRTQELWEDANRTAHTLFVRVLEGGGDVVSTSEGDVVLDVRALLDATARDIGVGARLRDAIPPDAGEIEVMSSDRLALAQDLLVVIRALPVILVVLAVGLFGAAIALARGRRRETLRACGFGLGAAGLAALATRGLAGEAVVAQLAPTQAIVPAVDAAWTISTTFLEEAAWATLAYALLVLTCAWLAGPSAPAVWLRGLLAPYAHNAWLAYGALGFVILGLAVWGPTPALREPLGVLIIAALLAAGLEILRRQMQREHPGATPEEGKRRRREWLDRTAHRVRTRAAGPADPAPAGALVAQVRDSRLDRLDRLRSLRDAGVLDAAEFESEKRRVLRAADGVTPPAA